MLKSRVLFLILCLTLSSSAHAAGWFGKFCSWLGVGKHAATETASVAPVEKPFAVTNFGKEAALRPMLDRVREITDTDRTLHPGRYDYTLGWQPEYLREVANSPSDMAKLHETVHRFAAGETSDALAAMKALRLLDGLHENPFTDAGELGRAFSIAMQLTLHPVSEKYEEYSAPQYLLSIFLERATAAAEQGAPQALDEIVRILVQSTANPKDLKAFRTFFDKAFYVQTDGYPKPKFEPPTELMRVMTCLARNNDVGQHTRDLEVFTTGFLAKVTDEMRLYDDYLGGGHGFHNAERVNNLASIGKATVRALRPLLPQTGLTHLGRANWEVVEVFFGALQYDNGGRRPIGYGVSAGQAFGFDAPREMPQDVYGWIAWLLTSEDQAKKQDPLVRALFTERFHPKPWSYGEAVRHAMGGGH